MPDVRELENTGWFGLIYDEDDRSLNPVKPVIMRELLDTVIGTLSYENVSYNTIWRKTDKGMEKGTFDVYMDKNGRVSIEAETRQKHDYMACAEKYGDCDHPLYER